MTFPDGLRAIAALMVILPHSVGLFAYWSSPSLATRMMIQLAEFGALGVQIFFVLSGFVIAFSLQKQKITPRFFGNFMIRRSIRLDPPYWAAIAFFYLYIIFRSLNGRGPVSFPSSGQLISHLFYAQGIIGYDNINVVFWTLCIEMQFYLIFCLLLGIIEKLEGNATREYSKLPFVVLYVLSLAWPAQILRSGVPAGGLFLEHWYAFLLGAIMWWVIEGNISIRVGYAANLLLFALVAILTFFEISTSHERKACLAVACTASAILLAAKRNGLYRWLDYRPIQFLGGLSYSIYLIHVPIAGIILGLQTRLAPKSESLSFLLMALVIVTTIGFAFVFNRLIEVPSLRLSRRFKVKNTVKLAVPDDSGDGPSGASHRFMAINHR